MKKIEPYMIFTFIFTIVAMYICYVVFTAKHTKGCTESYQKCTSSHKEIKRMYWGGRWRNKENVVCDDWETVTYDSDCITYNWFWKH